MKKWGDITFMKEWVKALDKTRILASADIRFVLGVVKDCCDDYFDKSI